MKMGKLTAAAMLAAALTACPLSAAWAQDKQEDEEAVHDIGTVQVMERGENQAFEMEPSIDVINVDSYETPGTPSNIADILKDLPIIDFRLETDLVPDDDSVYMRGFDSSRFATAVNGLTVRQSGGRKSSNIVDYGALLPMWMIGDVEVLPGPHSALYPAKSIGGVINIKPRKPVRKDDAKPEVNVGTSYASYNTQSQRGDMHGGVGAWIYDAGAQRYSTGGYLRNTQTEIMTYYGRGGYVFEDEGFLTLSYMYVDADRNLPINNAPGAPGYDSSYPTVENGTSAFEGWQGPSSDKIAKSVDLYFTKPTGIGEIDVTGSYRTENRDRSYDELQGGVRVDGSWDTKWEQRALKVSDAIGLTDANTLIVGFEGSQLFDGYGRTPWVYAYSHHERVRTLAGFFEDQWDITPRLHLRVGTRYEAVRTWVVNTNSRNGNLYIPGRGAWIERNWDGFIPKSFLTWELDDVAPSLRDTSLSVGVSRVWRAPDYHGDLNPQGRPAGAWLKPEQGMGYDVVLQRRLWGDVQFKMDLSYYEIYDYMAYNSRFSKSPVFEDWKINLDKMQRLGGEIMFSGHMTDDLSFYLGYAYSDLRNMGEEPAGASALGQRARHRVNAGISYDILEGTTILADYKFQDREVVEIINEPSPGVFTSNIQALGAYQLVNLAVQHELFDSWGVLGKGTVKGYINNLFDERYENVTGYPGTDRTYGVSLSLSL